MVKLVRKRFAWVAVFAVTTVMPAVVQAQVTLPTLGIDVEDYIQALITALSAVVGVCVAGWFAFLALKKGLGWVRKIG